MRRAGVIALVVLAALGSASDRAQAEAGEKAVGLEAAIVFPSFASQDPTAFALATWGLGGFGQYGLLEDLDLYGRLLFASFSATLAETKIVRGRALAGELRFRSTEVHAELGLRYKLIAGYLLAPYLEALAGFRWATYRDHQFVNAEGQSYGLEIADVSEGAATVSLGLAVDYRFFDCVRVGVALRLGHAFGARAASAVRVPLEVSYFW